jgi:hypothetical protein
MLTALIGAPIIASLPHFYLADREYQTGVIGLNPTKEKHEIFSIFDPVSVSYRLTYSHSPDAKLPDGVNSSLQIYTSSSFSNDVSKCYYKTSNNCINCEVLSGHFPGWTTGNHKKTGQDGDSKDVPFK